MSVHVPSLHVPSVRMPSLDGPVAASRDLIDTLARAADALGENVLEPVVDAVTDGVGTIADGVTGLLPTRHRNRNRRVVALAVVGMMAIAVAITATRRRAVRRARRTQDSLAVDLAERSDRRDAPSGDAAESDASARLDAQRDAVHAAD